jgi:hypothetical protein
MAATDTEPRPGHTIRRVLLGALTALLSVNLWTGSPLLAVWLGSRVEKAIGSLSMAAVGVVILALAVQSLVLLRILAALNRSYDELLGREATRYQAPWLKSLGAERKDTAAAKHPLGTVEKFVIASVVVAVCGFEVWFFFFAGSSLPNTA